MTKNNLTPKSIVAELDRHIIGQTEAKKAVAIALRNRWRRQQLPEALRDEVLPKNILMIGPTGVGKTEIARRLAKLADAPFLKVEATKFTEVGYVGRDVDSIIRDLLDIAINQIRARHTEAQRGRAHGAAEDRILTALVGDSANPDTREKFRTMLQNGEIGDREIELDVADNQSPGTFMDIPGMPGSQMGMINMGDMLGKMMGGKTRRRKLRVDEAMKLLLDEEADKLIDQDKLIAEAIDSVEQNGIVFIDEFDKIAVSDVRGGSVSREGVQRDLLPLIEGTTVTTKHGMVKTDYILFIASGAFHVSKPSDLLPELQGRLPIRVELSALTQGDFKRILLEPEGSLIKQYVALLNAEQIALAFDDSAIDELARLAFELNSNVENIGARRLHTVLEKLLEDLSFEAPDRSGEAVTIAAGDVRRKLENLAGNQDLSRYVL